MPATLQHSSGLEVWFEPAGGTNPEAPSQHRMALVLFLVVYALISALTPAVKWLLPGQPAALRLLLTVGILVTLMTYVVLPLAARLLSKWAHKASPAQRYR